MKRTINEVYELIKQKLDNAKNEFEIIRSKANDFLKDYDFKSGVDVVMKNSRLVGEVNAYADVVALIEESGVLEEDKEIKELRNRVAELENSVDYWQNEVFKKIEVKLTGFTKEKIQEIRKQVCDEIRDAFKKQFRDGMCGGRFEQVVPIDCFNSIFDQIEKGEEE